MKSSLIFLRLNIVKKMFNFSEPFFSSRFCKGHREKDYFFTIVSKEVLVLVLVLFLLFSLVHMLCLASSFNFLGQAEA